MTQHYKYVHGILLYFILADTRFAIMRNYNLTTISANCESSPIYQGNDREQLKLWFVSYLMYGNTIKLLIVHLQKWDSINPLYSAHFPITDEKNLI